MPDPRVVFQTFLSVVVPLSCKINQISVCELSVIQIKSVDAKLNQPEEFHSPVPSIVNVNELPLVRGTRFNDGETPVSIQSGSVKITPEVFVENVQLFGLGPHQVWSFASCIFI